MLRRTQRQVRRATALLLPTAPVEDDPQPSSAVVGDSHIARMGAAPLVEALGELGRRGALYVYGTGGKELIAPDARGKSTLDNIAEARRLLGVVGRWSFSLGTNNLYLSGPRFRTEVDRVLDAIGDDPADWIDIAFHDGLHRDAWAKNAVLEAACAARPNVTYRPWNAWVHADFDPADWLAPEDTTHMSERGYERRARFIAETLERRLVHP